MFTHREHTNRLLLRARDTIDRDCAAPLDIPALAAVACMSPAHFIRSFRACFGETPHRYLQRRRIQRAMTLLRETDRPITDICFEVGFSSPGTFTTTFKAIVGCTPTAFRRTARPLPVPSCFINRWTRPAAFTRK